MPALPVPTPPPEITEETPVATLIDAILGGDELAWNELVRRYARVVRSVIWRHRLWDKDAEDVSQTVWLRLIEHLSSIREPEALVGWLSVTTRNECLRQLTGSQRTLPMDPMNAPETAGEPQPEPDAELLRAERYEVLRHGLAELAPRDRELLLLLIADPPVPYVEIARRLEMPIGGIGPTRKRCLDKLRRTQAVTTYLESTREVADPSGGCHALAGLE
jgi:RNA polymerase sigma factor (sigma-70 family)